MPGHAPYLMPDGQPLSKYLTLETENKKEKKAHRKRHRSLRGKDEIWELLKRQQSHAVQNGNHGVRDEFGIAEKMGSRRRTRWINDKSRFLQFCKSMGRCVFACRMLRDMTGPMTMDQIEAQFCPPPWGDVSTKKEPFHALFEEHHALWEVMRNIDVAAEQKLIHDMESSRHERNGRSTNRARTALKAWQKVPRRLRRFMKTVNPTIVLETEMQLLDFKNNKTPVATSDPDIDSQNKQGLSCLGLHRVEKGVWIISGQSRYLTLIFEALCQFHRLRFNCTARTMEEEESTQQVFDLEIKKRKNAVTIRPTVEDGVEVTCSDIVMAIQEMETETLNAKSLLKFVMTQIHGTEEAQ